MMDQPGEDIEDEATGSEVIHQPPTANPGRTRVDPADLSHQRDEQAGMSSQAGPEEEGP